MFSRIPVLVIALLFCLGAAQAATYKIATISPDGLSWMQKFRTGVKEIERKTEGRVGFKIYPGGVQGDDATVLRKMRIGQLHGGVIAAGSLTRFYPDLQIYNLPLQFRNYREVDHIRAQMDGMIAAGLEEAGMVILAFAETGFAYLLTRSPVSTVAQLRELKGWIPDNDSIAAELVKSFGVSPIPLNITDVLAGLQTGLIDAVVVPPAVVLALQWHNHVSYMTNIPLLYTYSMLAMDRRAFDSMSADDRLIVRSVMDSVFRQIEQQTRTDNERALAVLQSTGIEWVEVAADSRARWQAVADESVRHLIQSGEIGPEAVERYLASLRQYRASNAAGPE